MSLINQMLRDLQSRKEGGGRTERRKAQGSPSDSIPFLPLPVVLGGTAILLVALFWWLAGVLADSLFRPEPVRAPVAAPVQSEAPSMVSAQTGPVIAAPDNSPVAPSLPMASAEEAPVPAPVAAMSPAVAPPTSEEPTVAPNVDAGAVGVPAADAAPVVAPDKPSSSKSTVAITKTQPPVKTPPAETSRVVRTAPRPQAQPIEPPPNRRPAVMPAPKPVVVERKQWPPEPAPTVTRLHPDELPGAVASPALLPDRGSVQGSVPRAAVTPWAGSPYGAAETAYRDGLWAFEQGRTPLAVRSLQYALESYPGHLPARSRLIEHYIAVGKNGEAMLLLADGLEIAPDYLPFKKEYARLLLQQGDAEATARVLLAGGMPAVDVDPEAHVLLASAYQRLGEAFLAAQTYRNLLVAWPQTGAFWVGLGGALEAQQLSEEAIECYRRALETGNLRQDLGAYARRRLALLD